MSGNEIEHDHSGDGLYILGKNKETRLQKCQYCGGDVKIVELYEDNRRETMRKTVTCTICGLSAIPKKKMADAISEWNQVIIDNN